MDTTEKINFTLKSNAKFLHNSVKHGVAERYVYIDVVNLTTDWHDKTFNFLRKIYYGVEEIIQPYVSAELSPTFAEISEVINLVKVPFDGGAEDKERFYNQEDVNAVFMSPYGKTISRTKDYFKGNLDNIETAVLLGTNSDQELINIGLTNFTIVE